MPDLPLIRMKEIVRKEVERERERLLESIVRFIEKNTKYQVITHNISYIFLLLLILTRLELIG
jgi:hypothetical protein